LSEKYKNLLFPMQENQYQFLFPIGKIGKIGNANGHPGFGPLQNGNSKFYTKF